MKRKGVSKQTLTIEETTGKQNNEQNVRAVETSKYNSSKIIYIS